MSYRRSYQGVIHYSGSVSYPASQNGGTAHYSGSEPVYITIDVDTESFDRNVDGCKLAVDGLGAAVVATEEAEVQSKREYSRRIGETLIGGFFNYVGAELSQKIKDLASQVEARMIEMMSQKEGCESKQKQMQDDYQRITRRYAKLFEDLDKECVSRIQMLDKPVFQFNENGLKTIGRAGDAGQLGIAAIGGNEAVRLETILASSHVKQAADELISKSRNYLQGTYELEKELQHITYRENADELLYIPVMMLSYSDDKGGGAAVYGTDGEVFSGDPGIKDRVLGEFDSCQGWQSMDSSAYNELRSYFFECIQQGNLDERTGQTMLRLFDKDEYQTVNNNR